ncbi:SGNH/GDSL hydrolase family protein [Candidatus Latescibacterota bacterium]
MRNNLFAIMCGLVFCLMVSPGYATDIIDPSSAVEDTSGTILWYDLRLLDVEGRGWTNTESFYDRLPSRARDNVRKPVWNLSLHSAGMYARFITDATEIHARWSLRSEGLAMPHMPATGVSGLDLYVRHEDGAWRWLNNGRPVAFPTNTARLVSGLPEGIREYMIYLPLYNGVTSVEIAIPKNTTLRKAGDWGDGDRKPLIFYGTSITQGACASRPGMVHTSILGRRLNRPVINLGFSGNGRLEPELAHLMAELDPAVFVLDCLPNLVADQVAERTEPFVRILRESHPTTPILLVEGRTYPNSFLVPATKKRNTDNWKEYREAYDRLKLGGDDNIFYLEGDTLLLNDSEGTVDNSHPNDYGFMHHADAFMKVLEPILNGTAPPEPVGTAWRKMIRADHPRIFINRNSFPVVKANALGRDKKHFDAMKARVDKLLDAKLENKDYGVQSCEAAFVLLVTGDERYFPHAVELLKTSVAHYHDRYVHQKPVHWYAYSRICAWAAYDWLFNDMSREERMSIGKSFIDAVEQVQPTDKRHYFFPQENWSGTTTGFYGVRSLKWYAGLATCNEDIDDRADTFLEEGYRLNIALVNHRRKGAGDDGGSASACMNYVMAAYPWSEFNFFHTFLSATGENIAPDWPHASYLPGYLYWNLLPGLREFGVGDSPHTTNRISLSQMRSHLLQIMHFYGDTTPKCAAFAKWMYGIMPRGNFGRLPFTPFLLTGNFDDIEPLGPAETMPYARHFTNMGQVFMRSGAGENDTYALFMSGGVLEQHKHFDNNHFAIYRNGFQALDTGSRPPGQHTQHYYPRTIAHNCILIHMPGESLPVFVDKGAGGGQRWGAPAPGEEEAPIPNDGGQNKLLGSTVVAFETHDDYSYTAGDATAAYSPKKCNLALRQMVFLNPDYFVIFDRVMSTEPEHRKSWLIHTATEPVMLPEQVFTATQENGRLFARILLPEHAVTEKIGGPGKQFWIDGRNYPMPQGHSIPDSTQLLGQWRVEVTDSVQSHETNFLHLIHVGDADLDAMVESELLRENDRVGVRFTDGSKVWEVLFGTGGEASGHIIISHDGTNVVDRELTQSIMPQKGLFGTD